MKKTFLPLRRLSLLMLTALSLTAVSCSDDDSNPIGNPGANAPDVDFTALTTGNKIAYYNARNLSAPISTLDISGLQPSETLLSIDYRPATGQLYALGSTSRLYFINEQSGQAIALGAGAFTPAIASQNASIDFNPTVDRIRLVTDSGQNLRLHPELGTVAATDGSINGGTNPKIGAVAYTNSMAGASATMLYDIDFQQDKLYIQNPPNDGGLQVVGDLTVDFAAIVGFDIIADNSVALAVTADAEGSKLYTINLETAKAEWVGNFGTNIRSIAFKTNPVAFATTAANKLHRFNPMNPAENAVDLMGMLDGETITGLDFRPATGTLYAITSQSRLLTVNTANGQVTPVGAALTPAVSGTAIGFDFNPMVDRIRLVTNTGQNLRLHPDLGTVAGTDGSLNPGSPSVSGAAYSNNYVTTTSTVLYVLDAETNMLYTQTPPNDGTLVPVGAIGVDITADNGFDIGGSSNMAFGLLKANNTTAVYSFNLTTGAATKVKDFNINATAMAVGLGF